MRYVVAALVMCSMAGAYTTSSFRSQSTAGLWSDDYDLLFEPARIPLVAGSRVYTGLSNMVSGSEEQFGSRVDNFYLVGGSTSILGPFHPGLVFDRNSARTPRFTGISNELGDSLFGEARLVETELLDLDSNGTYDHKRVDVTDVQAWDETGQTDVYAGLGFKSGSLRLGVGYARADWQSRSPSPGYNTVFESRDSSLVDGKLVFLERDSGVGTSRSVTSDNRIIANAWYDMTSVRLGLLADYTPLSRDYSFEGRRRLSVDRSPANPLIADYVHAQVTDTMASPYSGNRMSAMLSVFYLPSAQVESRFYLSGSMQSQTMADDAGSFFAMTTDSVARPGTDTACDTTYGRYAGTQSNKSLSLSTRQLFTVTPAFRLGLGLGFSTAAFQDSLLRAFIDRSYTAHNNGDTISGHEDWRRRVSSSADWLMRGTSSTNALSLPVGIEYKVVPAIALRLGFSHTITWSDQTWIEQLVASSPALTRIDYGDGTYSEFLGTAETQPGRSETHKTTAHATRYTYGIGFNPIDNLQIDLMGFAKLTDLANWRLSATLKF